MRFMLCTVFVLTALLVANARGQENSDEDNNGNNDDDNNNGNGSSVLDLFRELVKSFQKIIESIKALFRGFAAELDGKTKGVVTWTQELWTGMKKEMNEWIDDYDYATEEEKDKMRVYLEKLEMPQEESEEDDY